MKEDINTLPSGKAIVRTFADDGQLVEETHRYGLLDIACTMRFANGIKIEEMYFVQKRMVRRARYEKARLGFPDMPSADQRLPDVGGELARAARKESRQISETAKRRKAHPLSEQQKEEASRQIPLFQAAGQGDVEMLRQLLDRGDDPNWISVVAGHTPLYNACFGDSAAAVRLLIERGADPKKRFEYHSFIDGRVERELMALMFAGSVDVAETLLSAGADVNVHDANGVTPLMRAASRGLLDVVRVLLRAGASAEARSTDGKSAVDFANDKMEFYRQQGGGFDASYAEKRIEQFKEICRLLAVEKA